MDRIKSIDKTIINMQFDVNQLVPIKYNFAWDRYLIGCANHWMPQEIPMQDDIQQWKTNVISLDEKLIVKRNLGFFSTADSLAANNIVLGIYRHVAPEARMFLLRQAFEECLSEDTEVLTSKGFVQFNQLTLEHKVAQYNSDKTIEFVTPSRIVVNDFQGYLYQFTNGGKISQLVTAGHRMPCLKDNDDGELYFTEAKDVSYSHNAFPLSGYLKNPNGDKLTLWEKFLIAFQADGSFQGGKYRNGNRCGAITALFTFKKERKINRFDELIKGLGFNFTKTNTVDSKGRFKYSVKVPLEFKLSKTFDWVDLSTKSSDWCQDFILELAQWDGSFTKGYADNVVYASKIKLNTDVIQAIASLCGYSTVYRLKIDNRKETFSDMHYLTITKRTSACRGTVQKSTINYQGKVYCVTVPSGAFIVRHNNKVSVTGNCIHTHAYQYIVQSLGLDEGEIFNAYREIPSIKAKDDFLIPFIETLTDSHFKTGTFENDQKLLKSIIVFSCIMEGLFFYVGFVQILALGRRNKMKGASLQYQYILRDESQHLNFGVDLANQIKSENPHLWIQEFQSELLGLFEQAVELEYAYAEDTMPNGGVLGLTKENFKEYLRYICSRRCEQIGLPVLYPDAKNPFPWMSEVLDLRKEANFFETKNTEYQSSSSLEWD